MADTQIKENCSNCKYFFGDNVILGVCKRYPVTANKHDADWCGEYVFKKTIADITREALKIIDGKINCTAIEEGIERRKAALIAMCEEEKPKKRGRKPKNA